MDLIERSGFLTALQTRFETVAEGEGHCIFVSGEAGIGKTSLVKAFYKEKERKKECTVYQSACDALFTPRPLSPVYELALQMESSILKDNEDTSRADLFASFFNQLGHQLRPTLLIIEDIHWADEATLDFIKFLARRINRLHSLLILTYRDSEIHPGHPLRNVLGQLSPDSFSRLQLTPLSKEAVDKMSIERGYKGEDVYKITGGNPFYVTEILASYSSGIPDNIKDSILSVYHRLNEKTKQLWDILSIFPTGLELHYFKELEPDYAAAINFCVEFKILLIGEGRITFKHELYRRTIESSLSPFLRIDLNKRILGLLWEHFERNGEIERLIHHAKAANENEWVVKYAPVAARQAAAVGAHIEASKLFLSAIEYYQGYDANTLIEFYESYAYECYLTKQIREAIIYTTKALHLLEGQANAEKLSNCMRFLSRLWWFDGNTRQAEAYARQAIDLLENEPASKAKAMAFSNMAQQKMLSNQQAECIYWAEKAIAMAKELDDEETLSHALNSLGTLQMRSQSTRQKGMALLQQSMEIALKNAYYEHSARAYTNFGSNAVRMRDYAFANKILEEGMLYCEERGLDSWATYLSGFKARLYLDTGNWKEALHIADSLIRSENQPPVVKINAQVVAAIVKMRKGEDGVLPLLMEAKSSAFETTEPQRILPVLTAFIEYEWITGLTLLTGEEVESGINLIRPSGNEFEKSEFAFWLLKTRGQTIPLDEMYEGYLLHSQKLAQKATRLWEQLGCPYEQALALFESTETDKRKALGILDKLDATAVLEKMKFMMRASGIRQIPRGIRESTRANPANLTTREIDILQLLKEGLQDKEIAGKLFISPKTVSHHISAIFFKLDVNNRAKAVQAAAHLAILK